ncbi:hypothetical protein ABBQ32_006281 [Trebouxia sp. C0010 RCD-2024]
MPSSNIGQKIGFIGAGNMAEALAQGFIAKKKVAAKDIWATDISQARKQVFQDFGANAAESSSDVVKNSDIVFISVKPQYVSMVIKEFKQHLTDKHVIVSIAAGIPLKVLQEAAGPEAKVIRVMPNTPVFVGEVASAIALGDKATKEDSNLVSELFNSVGYCAPVPENLINAVTGVSGSGPAYVFIMIEALADGGVRAGLPRDISQKLAAQTVLGSAKMVLESGKHPGQLKDMVTSPAGTTITAVHELEKAGVRAAFINAVLSAADKSEQLAKL